MKNYLTVFVILTTSLTASLSFAGANIIENLVEGLKTRVKNMSEILESFPTSRENVETLQASFESEAKKAFDIIKELQKVTPVSMESMTLPVRSEYVRLVVAATQKGKIIPNLVSEISSAWNEFLGKPPRAAKTVKLMSPVSAILLIDSGVITQERVVTLASTPWKQSSLQYEIDEERAYEDIKEMARRIEKKTINLFQIKAVFSLIQKAFGNVSWRLVDRIENEWQLRSLEAKLNYYRNLSTYFDSRTQDKYAETIANSSTPTQFRLLSADLRLQRQWNLTQDRQFIEIVERNENAAEAFEELVKMQDLLQRLDIYSKETYIVLLSRIQNKFQIDALKHLNSLNLLPLEYSHTQQEVIRGAKKSWENWIDRQVFDTSIYEDTVYYRKVYKELDEKDIKVAVDLLLTDIPGIQNEESLQSFKDSLGSRFNTFESANQRIQAIYGELKNKNICDLF